MSQIDNIQTDPDCWPQQVPSGWSACRLKDLGYLYSGLSGKAGEDFTDESELSAPFVPFTNIANNFYLSVNNLKSVIIYPNEKQNLIRKNDLFFLMSSEGHEDIGKSSILIDDLQAATYLNSFCKGFRFNKLNINPTYVNYLLHSESYRNNLKIEGKGFTRINLKMEKINDIKLLKPPLDEQNCIVQYLDKKTMVIDCKIDLLRQKAERYGKLKQSLINESVKFGLDKTVVMKDSGIEWIGQIPSHWEVTRISDIAKQNKLKNTGLIEKNLLSLSYGRIIRKDFNTSFGLLPESFETYQVLKQGIIILRLTDLQNDKKSLRVGHVDERGIITSAYVGLMFNKKMYSKFSYYLLHVYDLCKLFYWFGGGLRSTMRYEDVKIIPFLVPPRNEQKKIADYLDEKVGKIDQIVININAQIEKLIELRKTLINEVVTGKIKVTDEGLAT